MLKNPSLDDSLALFAMSIVISPIVPSTTNAAIKVTTLKIPLIILVINITCPPFFVVYLFGLELNYLLNRGLDPYRH